MQCTYTVPGGFPQDTVDVNQIEHFLNHVVCNITAIADNGFTMVELFDAILIHTKACRPNGK